MCWYVGSYYWTNKEKYHEELFGGKWEKIEGKLIDSADNIRKVDSTGREEKLESTINEIPFYSHTPKDVTQFLKYSSYCQSTKD